MVKTKIFATIGPASNTPTALRKMFDKGLDGVRLNFSHGSKPEHVRVIAAVRKLNGTMRRSIKIMQDLEGYRIRVGKLKSPIALNRGMRMVVTQKDICGEAHCVPFDYRGSLRKIKSGSLFYIDDGRIVLEVVSVGKQQLTARVRAGGILNPHKGINIPGVKLDFDALTKKDTEDVRVAIEHKLDYVAQSFVRNRSDLKRLKKIVLPGYEECKIFAKVENQEALRFLDEIIDEADGIIVARGDLGICVPIFKVPIIQKEIIKRCRRKGKPVMVATQMLDSMTHEPLPTRAEVSDVANAILDGATHLLLSGETAVGKYPSLVVDMMNKIIKHTEGYERKIENLLT